MQNIKIIRPFVIGLGVAGKRHLEAQLNLGIKTGIYSTNPQTKQFYKKNTGVIIFDNLEDGINWSNLVHVCTPDDKHTEFVARAIKKGKTVLCEKAFTTNLKDALYLQKLAHKYGSCVMVGQNYRLTPTFMETSNRIMKGQLGKITKVETTYLHDRVDYKKRYKSKDFLYVGGPHAVDLACWIAGEQVFSIKAISENKLRYQITIMFSSGLLGNILLDASSDRRISGSDLIVYGEKGRLVSHNKSDKLLFYKNVNKKPDQIFLPNSKTFTIPLEVKIVDDYLLGRRNSYWPIPSVDEAINTISILDRVDRLY